MSKAASKSVRCPVCKAPATDAYRPFCSRRCADVDLGRWFSGGYAIAGSEDESGEDALPQGPSGGNGKDRD